MFSQPRNCGSTGLGHSLPEWAPPQRLKPPVIGLRALVMGVVSRIIHDVFGERVDAAIAIIVVGVVDDQVVQRNQMLRRTRA